MKYNNILYSYKLHQYLLQNIFFLKNLIFHRWFLDLFKVLFFNYDPRPKSSSSKRKFLWISIYLFVLLFAFATLGKMFENLNIATFKASYQI